MTALDSARWQFAVTASLHFLFVALTLGLVFFVASVQTRYVRTGDPVYGRMARFWGSLYAINYAVGIATGLVMEFEIGLNWSGLSRLTGDVFGAPLALETLVAFVLESTLLGMWLFGWERIGKRLHLALIWGVAATALLSAFWVMVSNAFLQHPVGYVLDGVTGTVRLADFGALLTNSALWFALAHVFMAAMLTGGLFVAGVSAWHLRRGSTDPVFRQSLRGGLRSALLGIFLTIGFGYAQFGPLDKNQPTKLAGGADADRWQAEMTARFGPGDYIPDGIVGASLGIMIMVANLLFLILVVAQVLTFRDMLSTRRWARPMLWLLTALIPVPFLTAIAGWIVREEGRQPWAVYGLLKTSDAVSPMSDGMLTTSTIGFTVIVAGLALLDWWLLARRARQGPGNEFLADTATEREEVTV